MEPIFTTFVLSSAGVLRRSTREEGGTVHGQAKAQNHVSVLVDEVVKYLEPKKGEVVVDATYGQGGHSKAIKHAAKVELIALDADPEMGVINANFADLEKVFKHEGVKEVNKVLFDLGWNRGQLEGKGFSFLRDEPLDMSYGPKPLSGFNAAEILNTWKETALADAFFGYGEERYARRIAKAVVARREVKPFETTIEFVETIRDSVPPAYRHGRLHFATRSFQALRVAVNDELGAIDRGVKAAWKHLACNGRIAVITFHSIEDRAVKRLFQGFAKEEGRLVLKKPLSPSRSEIISNPSARSAKLRVIEKCCD
ncbi:16S rRNA (cytosine(1402)-N(4))-methyltransferase RsmH [Candidatus Parcubacteria bacterium]|nr:16S rRNA (cytosine(1402)-N(4))-methyltransferase RsmH [Candidatus Parcubacteria bacterium]